MPPSPTTAQFGFHSLRFNGQAGQFIYTQQLNDPKGLPPFTFRRRHTGRAAKRHGQCLKRRDREIGFLAPGKISSHQHDYLAGHPADRLWRESGNSPRFTHKHTWLSQCRRKTSIFSSGWRPRNNEVDPVCTPTSNPFIRRSQMRYSKLKMEILARSPCAHTTRNIAFGYGFASGRCACGHS